MAKDGKGYGYPDPYNEVGSKDPNSPDTSGMDLYFGGYDEVMKMHGKQTGPMVSTPNTDSGSDMIGGTAPGEPNPGGQAQHK